MATRIAAQGAAQSAGVPAQITVAGMAAGLYGSADEWPPLVLLRAGTGHFPHLAHPARFARRLAATAQ